MRLLVVGKLNGQLSTAMKMAVSAGVTVGHVETIAQATRALRAGQGADLLMVDFELGIAGLIATTEAERIRGPVVASGVPLATTAQSASFAAEGAGRGFVGETVATMERQLIIETLEHCRGNRTHAANILGISIRTLRNKLKGYSEAGVSVPAHQGAAASAA
jgi:DNA-binding NtrC family response regulator